MMALKRDVPPVYYIVILILLFWTILTYVLKSPTITSFDDTGHLLTHLRCDNDDDGLVFHSGVKNHQPALKNIFLVNNIPAGGALKYVNDIKRFYPDFHYVDIHNTKQLQHAPITSHDILFINHPFHTGIDIMEFVKIKQRTNVFMVLAIHDYYLLSFGGNQTEEYSIHGFYTQPEIKLHPHVVTLFDHCNAIVFPSHFAGNVYSNVANIPQALVSYPSDFAVYRKELSYPLISNNVIHIGAFMGLSVYKGKEIVHMLKDKYQRYDGYKVEFKITGENIPHYEDSQDGFNRLIEKEEIHGLVYLSRWAETYCYAMTKYLNSGLPILYNNFGAFKERMVGYEGIYPVYQQESQYEEALQAFKSNVTDNANLQLMIKEFESFLDIIIANSKKTAPAGSSAKGYHASSPMIELRPSMKQALTATIKKDNLVIITSKIKVSTTPFSYIDSRSMYSTEQRFEQTLETIESIRQNIPNSYIVLFDNSQNVPANFTKILEEKVDVLLNYTDATVDFYTNSYKYKAYAELAQLLTAYNRFFARIDVPHTFKNIFKITGRYKVLPSFNISYYDSYPTSNIFKRDENLPQMRYYYTCFYKISPNNFHVYFNLLRMLFINKKEYIEKNILNLEEQIPAILDYNFVEAPWLGLRQNVAVWNVTNEI